MTKSMGKKNRGRMAPEQQRQEENGDAAASPHTYRKDRQHLSTRVRNFFNFPGERRGAPGRAPGWRGVGVIGVHLRK
ncbi:hypothetical protein [Paraburkholderia tropica]|uniref:hypothetical protein n=1 Tax=Paraburkholderia tropica TaxID=92647 RepID=UPI002AB2DA4B|nr:hypothetical protein [Paraburkholderia tropica]